MNLEKRHATGMREVVIITNFCKCFVKLFITRIELFPPMKCGNYSLFHALIFHMYVIGFFSTNLVGRTSCLI